MDAFEEAEEKEGWLYIQNILKVHQNLLGSLVHDRKKELVEFLFCAFLFLFLSFNCSYNLSVFLPV